MEKLPGQSVHYVLAEFYRLKDMVNEDMEEHQENYLVIRLVTVIEQFFRCVVEIKLKDGTIVTPEAVTLGTHIIDEIASSVSRSSKRTIKNRIISLTYSFQNISAITAIAGPKIISPSKMDSLDKLFKHRHNLVHSVDQPFLSFKEIKENYDIAEEIMRRVLDALNHANLSFHIVKGQLLQYDKDVDGSKKCYENALTRFKDYAKSDPNNPSVNFGIGLAQLGLGNHDLAIKNFDKVARAKPDFAEINLYRGASLFELGRYEEAARSCMAEISADSNNTQALVLAGMALNGAGEKEKALVFLDRAILSDPGNMHAYLNKGEILRSYGLDMWADDCNLQIALHMPVFTSKPFDPLVEQDKLGLGSLKATNSGSDGSDTNSKSSDGSKDDGECS